LTASATSDSEGSQYSEESYSSSEDEDEEPVLKYKRFAKEVVQSTCDGSEGARDGAEGTRDVINCIAVHPKFIALGTFKGTVKLLDHNGTFLKDREYHLHSQVINQIAVDEEGEFIATAADDGKVHVIGLFVSKYNLAVSFDSPAKSVAMHPHFSRSTNRVFVLGNTKLIMIEERRWPLGNKVTELYSAVERGSISSIKWKDTLIAWCNSESQVVRVYDTVAKEQISSITFEDEG
jgi:WD40 repeat protein